MEPNKAEKEKIFIAEQQLAYVRAVVIVFSTLSFFLLSSDHINYRMAYTLMFVTWVYGLFVILHKPHEKYPAFLAGWFTSLGDCFFLTLWIYATGGFYSPYHAIFYASIIAVAFRFNLRTTMFTSVLYTAAYVVLLQWMGQLKGHEALVIVRCGFIFISGFLTNLITSQTLIATRQKLAMEELMEEASRNQRQLEENQVTLRQLNEELRLKNDMFNHAEENARIGSYTWNLQRDELFYSNNLFRLLGHEPGDFEPTPGKHRGFIHPADVAYPDNMKESLLREGSVGSAVIRIINRSGETVHIWATGKLTGKKPDLMIIGTYQDITRDVNLRRELHEKNLELERNNSELASFSYIASHDLQEPVRKILTFTELVLQKEKSVLQQGSVSYLERILSAAKRMQQLIMAFLNYSRIENSTLAFGPTDLQAVMKEVENTLEDRLLEKGAELRYGRLPVIRALPLQIQQLMINLVSNALKYSKPETPPVITLEVEKVDGQNTGNASADPLKDYWRIRVSDNGIGFDQRYAEKIFEVFQRLHNKDEYDGTGIGLAICRKVAQAHNGFITAEGKPGEGAAFSVYLPAEN